MATEEIEHACGHRYTYTLLGKQDSKRYRVARLREMLCPACQERVDDTHSGYTPDVSHDAREGRTGPHAV